MGRHQLNMKIYDLTNLRNFQQGNRVVSNHRCKPWEQQESLGLVRYLQSCRDGDYKNSILVKNNGDVSVIRQIVDERYTTLTLTKLN